MKTNKKIAISLIVAVIVIAGAVLVGKFSALKKNPAAQPKVEVSEVKTEPEAQVEPEQEIIKIPASFVNTSGTVSSIDVAKNALTVKTDDGKNLSVVYNEKTTIYQMKNQIPETKTAADIVKGGIISVQYDSMSNVATSIMIGGRWPKI